MPATEISSPNGEKTASSRERILQAAKHLFARNGYENTSTVAIARDAGTSESQLMKHFGSKQGLLAAILDRGWTCITDRVQGNTSNGAGDRLFAMLEAIVIEMESDAELKELMTLEARRVRKDSRDVLISRACRQFVDEFDGLLSQLQKTGQIRSDLNLNAVRAALIGMVESLLREQVIAGRSELRADYGSEDLRKLLETFLPALGAPAHAVRFASD